MHTYAFRIGLSVFAVMAVALALKHEFKPKQAPAAAHAEVSPSTQAALNTTATPAAVAASIDATAPAETRPLIDGDIPLANARDRVILKPFGIRISPDVSPVYPERFSGHHVGVDFETTEPEQVQDVTVRAVCDGPVLEAEHVTDYGGLLAQRCNIASMDVTVIYGHLRQSSFKVNVGETLKRGDDIALLGTGNGAETDGERKHLHLGVREGSDVDHAGYVSERSDTAVWLDAMKLNWQ